MTNYYKFQAHFYDTTRWAFLYGRKRLIGDLNIQPGECVVEIGCGTGANFRAIQNRLQNAGQLIGVDCSQPMLRKAAQRAARNGWTNVKVVDAVYGKAAIAEGRADVVLFSYSLSMIDNWKDALSCAHSELRPGGRAGVVDFCRTSNSAGWFTEWLSMNHVQADRPCPQELHRLFQKQTYLRYDAWAGLWSFYLFVGARRTA